MKRILNYKTFINESSSSSKLTTEQIDFLNKYVNGKWKLNDEGFVDVDGDFDRFNKGLSDFKGIVFGKITGNFYCPRNNLTSLEGCPKEVGGDFDCTNNNLTSLEGAPKEVGGGFYCSYNKLTSLEGAPKEVGGNFYCPRNNLTSLEGCPKEVGGNFYCYDNSLTSLEFGPKEVGGNFDCSYNKLTSLEGAPKKVGDVFYLVNNEGVSSETLIVVFRKMIESKLGYSNVLKSLWEEIPIEDKTLLYTSDLDWIDPEEASKLVKLKKYNSIKKMI